MAKWEEHKKRAETGSSVSTLVNDRQLGRNRYYVTSVVKIIQFLASNNVALRGSWDKIHQEETGLFLRLLQYTIEKDAKLKEAYDTVPNKAKCTSWKIQNEIIDIMNNMVAASVVDDVKEANVKW